MVNTPMAPTSSETPAIAATAAVIMSMTRPKTRSISVWVIRVKSSLSPWRSVIRARTCSATRSESPSWLKDTSIS